MIYSKEEGKALFSEAKAEGHRVQDLSNPAKGQVQVFRSNEPKSTPTLQNKPGMGL